MKKGLGSLLVGVRCNAAHLWLVEAALRKEPQQCQEQSGAADWKKFQSFRKTVSRLLHKVLCVLIKYQTIWLRLLTGIITSNHRKKTCIWMYAPTSHIITPNWKPSKPPSAEVKHTGVLLIHEKRNKLQMWA